MDPFEFAAKMEEIGRANTDEFSVLFSVCHVGKTWTARVRDSVGGTVVRGAGVTPAEACRMAMLLLPGALERQGYNLEERS